MQNQLIKPSAIIAIHSRLPLIARQLWNVLFAKAYSTLQSGEKHKITEQDLLSYIPYETRNTAHLKGMLKRLVETVVEVNGLGKDTGWAVFPLLSGAELKEGICTYSFSPFLVDRLKQPFMYAKISLLIGMRYSSKYSLVLYEICCDYHKVGETPWIEIEEFQSLMGTTYKSFKGVSQFILKPALKEVNEKSNLKVLLETRKTGRSISHLKFRIEQNPHFQTEIPLFEPTTEQRISAIKNALQRDPSS